MSRWFSDSLWVKLGLWSRWQNLPWLQWVQDFTLYENLIRQKYCWHGSIILCDLRSRFEPQTWKSGLKVLFHFPDNSDSLVCCMRCMHIHDFKLLLVTLAAVSSLSFLSNAPWAVQRDIQVISFRWLYRQCHLKRWAEIKALNAEVSECLMFFAESICCVSSSTVVAPTLIKALTVFP